MSTISLEDVKKVAKLANLELSPEEEEKYKEQLSQILDYISQLQQLDTKDVPETNHVTGLENIVDPDVVENCLPRDLVLSQAPATHNGYFKVKAILHND
jgi:aspartyl-tRNA(Asn)/glutamyl-tRNA(Gln) amidotransferase subunit C